MANLTMRVGSRYYPAVVARNGRIKPGWVWIAGRQCITPIACTTWTGTRGAKGSVKRSVEML